ncbi:PF11148 family protein [Peptostreptococcaceae bacterium AS15]|nr:hypothetical protein HMPREF0379_0131 [[Eubacterium] yurii subsp. margaretiae ATCC 43715]EJP26049.1 PF11148 family protein [Peptostreptococcaceae bacterium AS15]
MNTLKLKFKLNDNKDRSISLKNVKIDATQDDIKALGNYIANNNMLIYGTAKVDKFIGAVVENTQQTVITA